MRASVGSIFAVLAVVGATTLWFRHRQLDEMPTERSPANAGVARVRATSPSIRDNTVERWGSNRNSANDGVSAQDTNPPTAAPAVTMGVNGQTHDVEVPAPSGGRALTFSGRKQGAEDAKVANASDQNTLVQQTRITCEFASGYNNGFFWEGKLTSGSAAWQGGPLTYDVIDAEAGTAQLFGSVGATGSMEGQAEAHVAVAANRAEFLSTLPNGHVVLTTVFNERDEQGRHIAVMSRHEGARGPGIFGSQFLGWCR